MACFRTNGSVSANDRLEAEVQSELENGRLVRLLCKFGFINERPEYNAFQLLVKGADLFLGSIEILGGQKRVTDTLSSFSVITSSTKSMRTETLSLTYLTCSRV